MRTVKVLRMRVAGKPIAVKFKAGMKNLADHWMAGKQNRNPRIPKGEVWVNARLLNDREKLKRVLAHEKTELELMLRKGYSYRTAHRIASKREASLARRVKLALAFLLLPLLFSLAATAAPVIYSDANKPSWYNPSLPANTLSVVMAPEYGNANFTLTQKNNHDYTPTITWSTATDQYIYGGKSLAVEVAFSSAVQFGSITLTPATGTTLFPIAVSVWVYASPGISLSLCYLRYTYSDGTNQTFYLSGTTAANAYTQGLAFVNATKAVTQIYIYYYTSADYFQKIKVYIEYSALKPFFYTFSGTTVTVSVPQLFNASFMYFVARFPKPIIAASGGTPFNDELYNTVTGTYTVTLASYVYIYTLAQTYTVTLYDAGMTQLASATGSGKVTVASDVTCVYVKLNNTLFYSAALINNSILYPQVSGTSITFYVQDYNQNYEVLKAYDLQGRLVHASQIDALHYAVLNLTVYASYQLTLWKPGAERAFGTLTISQSNYIITVLPTASTNIPANAIQAWYNQTDSNFYVILNCSNPPCTVSLRKYYPNGTSTILATWTCTQSYCRYTLLATDPLVSAEATDATGAKMMSFAGTSLFGLLNETQKQALQDIFSKVAQGWPQTWGGQAGLLAFGGVLIFLALSIPGYLLVGAIALGIYITLVGVVFNIWIVAGAGFTILIALAAIEYIIRQS